MPETVRIEEVEPVRSEVVSVQDVQPVAPIKSLPAAKSKPPFISGESRFSQFLDLLNTPQQLLFGALSQRPGETLLEAAERGARTDVRFKQVLAETLLPKGTLSEGQAVIGQSVAEGMFPAIGGLGSLEESEGSTEDKLRATLGLAGDISLDPALLIPFEKGAQLGRIGLQRGGGLIKNALPPALVARLRDSARLFSKSAFATEAEKRVIEIADLVYGQFLREKGGIIESAAKRTERAKTIAKETGLTKEQVDQLITAAVEEKQAVKKGVPVGEEVISEWQMPGATEESLQRVKLATDAVADTVPATTKAEVSKSIAAVRERVAKELAVAPAQVRTEGLGYKQAQENVLAAELRNGIPIQELEDARVDYILHLLTPEARKAVQESPAFIGSGYREFSPAHASQLARSLRGLSIREINLLAADGKLPGFQGMKFKQFMVEDPAALLAVRELRGAKAIADVKVLRQAADELGQVSATAPQHYVPLAITQSADPRLAAIGEQFKDVVFEPEVAGQLNKMIEKTTLPDGLNGFVKVLDSFHGIWKPTTLTIFPSYHTRNMVGNVWNNYLAGLSDPRWYNIARDLQWTAHKNPGIRNTSPLLGLDAPANLPLVKSIRLGGNSYTIEEFFKLADDFGVTGRGFVQAETPRTLRQLGGTITASDIPGLRKITGVGLAVGNAMEDNARLAHFLWRLDKEDTPLAASRSVKKYLFDYTTGLTDFEQKFMRRVMPFYSWTRFNLPLQVSSLVDNPRPFIRLAELERTIRVDAPQARPDEFNRSILPDFIKENAGIPVRVAADGDPEYFLLGGWLPAADLEILLRPGGIPDEVVSQVSPFFKEPIEQAFNTDSFIDRKIEEFPGEKQKFLGMDVRRRLAHAARNIRILAEIDRLMKAADKDLSTEETTRLGVITRTLFGLKSFRVDRAKQIRRKKAEERELRRKKRSLLRRGDAANAATIEELLEEED